MMFMLLKYCYNKFVFRPSVWWWGGWYIPSPLDIRVPRWRGDGLPDFQMPGLPYDTWAKQPTNHSTPYQWQETYDWVRCLTQTSYNDFNILALQIWQPWSSWWLFVYGHSRYCCGITMFPVLGPAQTSLLICSGNIQICHSPAKPLQICSGVCRRLVTCWGAIFVDFSAQAP